jgi:hypothetical protein
MDLQASGRRPLIKRVDTNVNGHVLEWYVCQLFITIKRTRDNQFIKINGVFRLTVLDVSVH